MKDDGGPAFPTRVVGGYEEGMTLRDYFAAHAPAPYPDWRGGDRKMKDLIDWHWYYADMMLAERAK